jgi:hypothetical protein
MNHSGLLHRRIIGFLTLVTLAAACSAQTGLFTRGQNRTDPQEPAPAVPHAAEDISGMYSFLKEGEFLQINLEKTAVTGYISRQGDSHSDNGVFMDQFFARADVQDHAVSFTTRQLHGMWFEFKGKFDRGSAKTKADDGYYILRGTLKELSTNADKSIATKSREVEFKLLAQPPDDSDIAPSPKDKKPSKPPDQKPLKRGGTE